MMRKLFCLFAAALVTLCVPAQEVKVDFNANNRPVAEGWDTAYISWNTNSIWFSGGDVISNTFSGITYKGLTIRRLGKNARNDLPTPPSFG